MELKCDSKWIDLKVEINKRDLLDVLFCNQTHKTVNRHGTQEWRCNLHLEDVDSSAHLMSVEYRRCASVSCHENVAKNVECPFTYKIIKCKMNGCFSIYKSADENLQPSIPEAKQSIRGINQY